MPRVLSFQCCIAMTVCYLATTSGSAVHNPASKTPSAVAIETSVLALSGTTRTACTSRGPPVITGVLDDPKPGTPFWLNGERFCDHGSGVQRGGSADCSKTLFTLTVNGNRAEYQLKVVSVVVGVGNDDHCASSAVLMFPTTDALLGATSNFSVKVTTSSGSSESVSDCIAYYILPPQQRHNITTICFLKLPIKTKQSFAIHSCVCRSHDFI